MMPPPRQNKTCVETIKKKFESINQAEAENPQLNKNLSAKTQLTREVEDESNCSISKSESPRKRKSPVGRIPSAASEASFSPSSPVKIVPLKVERQLGSPTSRNIRRSPAFRCDKIVRARNLIAQSTCRETPKSVVVRRVKQFDNQSETNLDSSVQHNSTPNVSNSKPVVAWRSKLKSDSSDAPSARLSKSQDINQISPSQKNDVEVQKKISLLGSNTRNVRKTHTDVHSAMGHGQSDSSNRILLKESLMTGTANEITNRISSLSEDRFDSCSKIETSHQLGSKENGEKINTTAELGQKCFKSGQSTSRSTQFEEIQEAIKAALESPLPSGPPPKKPPRTFAHVTVPKPNDSSSAMPLSQSAVSVQGKVSDALPLGVITKHARSKTESQILLRKLEIAIGSNQSANINSNKKIVPVDQSFSPNCVNSENNSKSNPRRDASTETRCGHAQKFSSNVLKDQKSSIQFSNCFSSSYCSGDSSVYSKIVESDCKSPGANQTVDCKSVSNGDVKQKLYGTLHKANSEEHIYAEPYEHMTKGDGSDDKLKRSLFSDKEAANIGREDALSLNAFLRPKSSTQGNMTTAGLHYLCSPIHENVSGQGNEMQARSLPVPFEAINRELVGPMGPNSLPVDASKGKGQPANPRAPSSAQSRAPGDSTDSELPINPTKIKLLMNQAFGSPLQRLPAVGVDSSDSDSVASTPDDGNNAPPLPGTALSKPPLRSSAGNANNVKEIRRPSVPPPDIPDMSKEALQQLTAERRVYIRRVSSHAMSTRSRRMSDRAPLSAGSHLFDCLLLVGVNLDPERPKCKVPYIKSTYPPDAKVAPLIEDLCFPDASEWPPPVCDPEEGALPGEEQCYSLVITNETGERKYGYCRRVQPEGANLCLPLAYCLLTSHRASGFYFKVLGELESRHGQTEALRSAFIKELYACGFPNPGQSIRVPLGDSSVSLGCAGGSCPSFLPIKRQYEPRLEQRDLSRLFGTLQVPVLLKVFGSVLLERKVLFISSSISKLSACVEALESLLFPFSWHHTFLPVLPASMLEVCNAPTPYILGVLRGKVPKALPQIEHGIAVDLDTSSVLQCMQDEMTILPANMNRNLRDALQLVQTTTPCDSSRNVVVSEAFVRLFVEVCGHYQNHIVMQQDGKRVFEKESFIKAVPSRYTQSFLEWFTETTMFSVFIDSRLDKPGEMKGMFEQRVAEHCEERDRNTLLYLKNYKGLNKKKTLGDRFKDWTPF